MTCTTCTTIEATGFIGDSSISHCRRCHVTWRGISAAHCTVCHQHFTSDSAFKRHTCNTNPGEMERKDGSPMFKMTERGWSLAPLAGQENPWANPGAHP